MCLRIVCPEWKSGHGIRRYLGIRMESQTLPLSFTYSASNEDMRNKVSYGYD